MKKTSIILLGAMLFGYSCTVQKTTLKSSFGYSSLINIPESKNVDSPQSAKNVVINMAQLLGMQQTATRLTNATVTSAKIEVVNVKGQKLDIFKSVKLFLADENSEVMIGSKNDIPENIGNKLVLELDNTRFIDNYVKDGEMKFRLEYVLRKRTEDGINVKASVEVNSTQKSN